MCLSCGSGGWGGHAAWTGGITSPRVGDGRLRESETEASATLGRSQDVCKGARFPVQGDRCVVESKPPFKGFEVNDEDEKGSCIVESPLALF